MCQAPHEPLVTCPELKHLHRKQTNVTCHVQGLMKNLARMVTWTTACNKWNDDMKPIIREKESNLKNMLSRLERHTSTDRRSSMDLQLACDHLSKEIDDLYKQGIV